MAQYRITKKLKSWVELMELINGERMLGDIKYTSSWTEDLNIPVEDYDYINITGPGDGNIVLSYDDSAKTFLEHIALITFNDVGD